VSASPKKGADEAAAISRKERKHARTGRRS
jgi:hypothetical protein